MLEDLIVTIYGYILSIHRLIDGFGPHVVPTAKIDSWIYGWVNPWRRV